MRSGKLCLHVTVVLACAFGVFLTAGGAAGAAPFGPGPRAFRAPPLLQALDGDGNGELSAEEIAGASEALKQLDRDKNGTVSRQELFGRRPAPGRFRPRAPGAARPAEGEPLPKDDRERKILQVLNDMDRNQRRGMMNVPREDGRLLRLLAEATNAKHIAEIGTSNGYSGIWQCVALIRTGGKLTTFEINQRRASLARENFKRAGVSDRVTLILGDAHKEVEKLKGPLDMVFIDADKSGYPDYLKKLLPLVRPGGLIVAHNMNRPAANPDYVKAVTTDPALETLFFHMQGAGIAVTLKKR